MRIQELYLKAYGVFSDRRLDLSDGSEGLHVIFGPNEAGKSTALRALRGLLYGIEERTKDAFHHESDQLRVGGTLRSSSGREIAFIRRKGRKNTLLSPDETRAIDDIALVPFLAGVSEDVFSSLFGIDHRELVEGGDQILQQKGEVGQALFAAALGSQHFYSVLRELEEEAGELYRPHASKYPVNKGVTEVTTARRRMKDASLAVRDWAARRKRLEDLNNELEDTQSRLAVALKEQSTVGRLQRVLPLIAKRQVLLGRLGELGSVVVVPGDLGSRRRSLSNSLAAAEQAIETDNLELEQVREEQGKLPAPMPVLAEGTAIDAALQEVGSYRKSLRDRPAIEGKRQQARNDARDILKGLRSDISLTEVGVLRPQIAPAKSQIHALAVRHQALEVTERKARKALAEAEQQVLDLEKELASLPKETDLTALRRAVASARRSGDLDRQVSEASRAAARAATECEAALRSLGLWTGTLQELAVLPLPVAQTVDRYEAELQEAQDGLKALRQQHRQLLQEAKAVSQAMSAMQAAGAIPTEAQLREARRRRDEGWTMVKDAWASGADASVRRPDFDPESSLTEAYEASVSQADDVADQLRLEADRVAGFTQNYLRSEQLAGDAAQLERQIADSEVSERKVQTAWVEAWAPAAITPLSPREMRAWLDRVQGIRSRLEQLSELEERRVSLVRSRAEHRSEIHGHLASLGVEAAPDGDAIEPLLGNADELLESHDAAEGKRKEHQRGLVAKRRAAEDLRRATSELEDWRTDWGTAVRPLALDADARPGVVESILESYVQLFAKLDEEDDFRRRIYGIDKDIEEFEASVRGLAARVDPQLDSSDVARCVEQLSDQLKRASSDEANRLALAQQEKDLLRKLTLNKAAQVRASEGLQALCREAGCESPEQLDEAERRSADFLGLREQVAELESAIVQAGDGGSLEALIGEAEGADPDTLAPRLDRATQEVSALESERARILQERGAEESEFRKMTGSSAAAEAAEELQESLASLGGHVEHYLRVRVAADLLRREVERYREANQNPLLLRASALFRTLTLDSFHRIQTEIGSDDEPRLVGVRPDGQTVSVEGMSSGCLDQLYLVLRLAALERFMEKAEPMPFVVDDILINFDDERAFATMKVLLEFSRRTQVLLFTHHSRVKELAQSLDDTGGVFAYELP